MADMSEDWGDESSDAVEEAVPADEQFEVPTPDDVLVLAEVDTALTLPVWEPTGEPRVDSALDLLAMLDVDDVSGHAEVFVEVHDRLRATLVDLDGR